LFYRIASISFLHNYLSYRIFTASRNLAQYSASQYLTRHMKSLVLFFYFFPFTYI